MAVPTIVHVTPSTGPTGGRRIVKIWGSNFQLPPPPPPTGIVPVANPSVAVLFGTVPAREVRVLASSRLDVVTPIHDEGAVSITVKNIDQDGNDIPGESVVAAAAYTFARPDFTQKGDQNRSVLTRLVRAILQELKRQVIANVELTTHTDYDDTTADGANIAALASIPGLVLSGPTLRQNRFFNSNQAREVTDADAETYEQRPTRTVDVVFTLIGVSELMAIDLDLMSECTAFFSRNTTLQLQVDPTDVSKGFVEYEMEIEEGGDFKGGGTATNNNSNLRTFSGSFCIRGLNIDDADMSMTSATTVAHLAVDDVVKLSAGDDHIAVTQIPE